MNKRPLRFCFKGELLLSTKPLLNTDGKDEDTILRNAFGRFGGTQVARDEAEPIVRRYQTLGSGRWFVCGCRDSHEHPSVLVPSSERFIRRHVTKQWPEHEEFCDFRQEPTRQRAIVGGFKRKALPANGFRLLRPFERDREDIGDRGQKRAGTTRRQPRLARVLMELMARSGLQVIGEDGTRSKIGDQFREIKKVATDIQLDENVKLRSALCTYLPKLKEFKEYVLNLNWSKKCRPHGILIVVIKRVQNGSLIAYNDEEIQISGRIAVFGEPDGDSRRPITEDEDGRPPYLGIILFGQRAPEDDVSGLSAYVHPCVSYTDLMLVDSDYERETLKEINSVRTKSGINFIIEKPVFDIDKSDDDDFSSNNGSDEGDDSKEDPDAPVAKPARDVIIPDFIITTPSVKQKIIVETMGFASDQYRKRKERTHREMSRILDGAPVIDHDFHYPEGWAQNKRDQKFWSQLRAAILKANGEGETTTGGVE